LPTVTPNKCNTEAQSISHIIAYVVVSCPEYTRSIRDPSD